MTQRKKIKYVHAGPYVAALEVKLIADGTGWSPCIGIDDALKLDDVRQALYSGDLETAAKYGQVYTLHPVIPSMGENH